MSKQVVIVGADGGS